MIRAVGVFAAVGVLAPVALAGCSGSQSARTAASPFTDCTELTSAPASTVSVGPGATGPAVPRAVERLPNLKLPCFTGDRMVNLRQIRGPAVINLWASWCPPCRKELPTFQRLADWTGGRMRMVGVVSEDDRGAAQSFAEEFGITFPTLYDRPAELFDWTGKVGMPVTLFVGTRGEISHVYNAAPLDDATLTVLVSRYLGVRASD